MLTWRSGVIAQFWYSKQVSSFRSGILPSKRWATLLKDPWSRTWQPPSLIHVLVSVRRIYTFIKAQNIRFMWLCPSLKPANQFRQLVWSAWVNKNVRGCAVGSHAGQAGARLTRQSKCVSSHIAFGNIVQPCHVFRINIRVIVPFQIGVLFSLWLTLWNRWWFIRQYLVLYCAFCRPNRDKTVNTYRLGPTLTAFIDMMNAGREMLMSPEM